MQHAIRFYVGEISHVQRYFKQLMFICECRKSIYVQNLLCNTSYM